MLVMLPGVAVVVVVLPKVVFVGEKVVVLRVEYDSVVKDGVIEIVVSEVVTVVTGRLPELKLEHRLLLLLLGN